MSRVRVYASSGEEHGFRMKVLSDTELFARYEAYLATKTDANWDYVDMEVVDGYAGLDNYGVACLLEDFGC